MWKIKECVRQTVKSDAFFVIALVCHLLAAGQYNMLCPS